MNLTETRAQSRRFERRIRELLAEGYPTREAVRLAYEEYPVMEVLRDEISDQIRAEAESGYGAPLSSGVTDRLFTQAWVPDQLTLSARTTGGVLYVQQMVAKTIEERIKKNDTYKNAALAIFEGYGEGGVIPEQDIPKFLRELEQVGRHASIDMKEVRAMLRGISPHVEKLTTPGMRAAYSRMLNAIEDQSEAALDNAIMVATQERTRYFAERIARTEMHRAYIDGFVARWDDDSDCIAYQWRLSSRHPCFDICDLYAKANLYGLGPGVFPKDKVPLLPAHPHCMCHLKPVIKGMLDNETPVERIEEGGREYIETLTLPQRRSLLGVYGEQQVAAGVSWTQRARGYSGAYLQGRLKVERKGNRSYNKVIEIGGRRAFVTVREDGTLILDKAYPLDQSYSPTLRGRANKAILYGSPAANGARQSNIAIYDEEGKALVMLHYGPHTNLKKHPYGRDETGRITGYHAHDSIVDKDGNHDWKRREMAQAEQDYLKKGEEPK